MKQLLKFFTDMPKEKNRFGLRVVMVLIAVFCQGIGVYWLTQVNFGTDPCTTMNQGLLGLIRQVYPPMTYGSTILIYNIILFTIVILLDIKQIGIGTLANMIIVGYAADFSGWVMGKILPENFFDSFPTRVIILIPALIWFIIAAATYMAVDLGQSPYDAVPAIISSKVKKIPFTVIRILWDGSMVLAGFLLGSTIGAVTVLIALFLGPAITFVKTLLKKICKFN